MEAADRSAVPEDPGAVGQAAGEAASPKEAAEVARTTPVPGIPGSSAPAVAEVEPEQRAEAALAEKSADNHKVTYRVGESDPLELQLPPKLHASVMFRAGVLRDDDGAGAARLIEAVLGPNQFDQVMDKMDAEGLTIDDEEAMTSIGNLLNDALATYGVTPGESQASPKS